MTKVRPSFAWFAVFLGVECALLLPLVSPTAAAIARWRGTAGAPHRITTLTAAPAATLSLQAAGESGARRLAARIDTGGSPLQEMAVTLLYPPDRLRLGAISLDDSACTRVTKQEINAAQGTLSFACAFADRAIRSQLATLFRFTAEPLKNGQAVISADPTSARLNTYRGSGDLFLSVTPLSIVEGTGEAMPQVPLLSLTHPRRETCSPLRQAVITWPSAAGSDQFEYALASAPGDFRSSERTAQNQAVASLEPGSTRYFNLRLRNGSRTGPASSLPLTACPS